MKTEQDRERSVAQFTAAEKFANARWPHRLAFLTHKKGTYPNTITYEVRLDHVEVWRADIHFVHLHPSGAFTVDAE